MMILNVVYVVHFHAEIEARGRFCGASRLSKRESFLLYSTHWRPNDEPVRGRRLITKLFFFIPFANYEN